MAYYNAAFTTIAPFSEKMATALTHLLNRTFTTGGLVIKAGASAIAKTATAVAFSLNGKSLSFPAGDVALTSAAASTILAGYARNFFLFLDASAAVTIVPSASVLIANVATINVMPDYDCNALVPFGVIKWANGSASTLTPATGALDTTDAVATYVNLSAPIVGQTV